MKYIIHYAEKVSMSYLQLLQFALLALTVSTSSAFQTAFITTRFHPRIQSSTSTTHLFLSAAPSEQDQQSTASLESAIQSFEKAFADADVAKTCKVQPALIEEQPEQRIGLIATQSISKGDVVLSLPYGDNAEITATQATKTFAKYLPEKYDSWTGEAGLMALALLNELAVASDNSAAGVSPADSTPAKQSFKASWLTTLPRTCPELPLLWSEEDQEVLQSSSTTKIYRRLDDIEEDATWLLDNVFSKDPAVFPETVTFQGHEYPCFSVAGFTWAMAMVQSRSFFLDQQLRLVPFLDMVNHDDDAEEIRAGTMGTFGTLKGAVLVADRAYAKGEQVLCSYGPKSAIDYLIEHGFVPDQCWKNQVSELTFEVNPEDRFYDDKLDILEFETYEQAPMDPSQSFDVVGSGDGEPDPAMVQFVRLAELGGTDAFLLESIFRKDVWGFMSLPVSEQNELKVVNAISKACQDSIEDLDACPEGGPAVCEQIRSSERKALERTLSFLKREKEALDLKEYYQERRLKDLGLDSEWSPEDDIIEDDLGFGQTRLPGGADYDW